MVDPDTGYFHLYKEIAEISLASSINTSSIGTKLALARSLLWWDFGCGFLAPGKSPNQGL
jgi:hypothetical protein